MHQLDNLSNFLRESMGQKSRQERQGRKSIISDVEPIKVPLMITLAIGGISIVLFRGFLTRS